MRLHPIRSQSPRELVPRAMGCRFALGAALLAALLLAAPSHASPDTFRRAIGNVIQGPLDVALSPALGGLATVRNAPEVADHPVLELLYAPFGWVGLTALQAGNGVMRTVTGALQLVPAVFLFPFEADLPDFLDPFSQGEALVEADNPLADSPPWLKYVPLLTPATVDLKLGVMSDASLYETPYAYTGD